MLAAFRQDFLSLMSTTQPFTATSPSRYATVETDYLRSQVEHSMVSVKVDALTSPRMIGSVRLRAHFGQIAISNCPCDQVTILRLRKRFLSYSPLFKVNADERLTWWGESRKWFDRGSDFLLPFFVFVTVRP
jgi:hypothetical protein